MGTKEKERLEEDKKRVQNWKRFGPYLSERQWATVREDYSANGEAWDYFPHEHARSRAYRWGEDGLLGITDRECRLCFALSFWNEKDPILKERLFGLTEKEGNHGEDVKEAYYYLDSTPTHSYMKALYKYPQEAFPYDQLVEENRKRGLNDKEFEIYDTAVFDQNRYFDIFVEYAKGDPNDILIKVKIVNRFEREARLHILPTLWFRNTWSWGRNNQIKPSLKYDEGNVVVADHPTLGQFFFSFQKPFDLLFTENETNFFKLYNSENKSPYVKDSFHTFLIDNIAGAVNRQNTGTKCAPHYILDLKGFEEKELHFRLSNTKKDLSDFDAVFHERKKEADEFYDEKIPKNLSDDEKNVARQAYGGLLWTKQFYNYIVKEWLDGDPAYPPPPPSRGRIRNGDWTHLYARDVISMPDKWEYPWFAAWDLAFHLIPLAKVDPEFAKRQVILFLREWYMHPNGEQPAYEYAFYDVNPPVHAWAAWRVYKITGAKGERDISFLESAFQKLLLNFTWWVNRKDLEGNHLFAGGFLGLDNIGVFNRSKKLPVSGVLEQADGTAWMAFYCLTLLSISLELACVNPAYEDMASKFFEHFIRIADAMNEFNGTGLWDEQDGFYYDKIKCKERRMPLRTRSLVGLLPLIAVEVLEEKKIKQLPGFAKRMEWFLEHRKDLENVITYCKVRSEGEKRLLAIPSKVRLEKILKYMLDETEFLSPFGIRSLSKYHEKNPYTFNVGDEKHAICYVPGEGNSYLFGGNSNWRGPIWFPINFLLIEALERYHHYYGDSFTVEFPTGSKNFLTLKQVADELSNRLKSIFLQKEGGRPCHGEVSKYRDDPNFSSLILFYEYFHGESGKGLGASHQTGWTSLVAKLFDV